MIGGYDIYFKIKDIHYPDLEAGLLEVCRRHWPEVVVEYDAEGGFTLEARIAGSRSEFFVYKTQTDRELWDNLGATADTFNTMIYFIIDKPEKELTMVVDDPFRPEDIVDIKKFCGVDEEVLTPG
jgi:hypothetical protein